MTEKTPQVVRSQQFREVHSHQPICTAGVLHFSYFVQQIELMISMAKVSAKAKGFSLNARINRYEAEDMFTGLTILQGLFPRVTANCEHHESRSLLRMSLLPISSCVVWKGPWHWGGYPSSHFDSTTWIKQHRITWIIQPCSTLKSATLGSKAASDQASEVTRWAVVLSLSGLTMKFDWN